ncbi:MAG: PP2C family serine/threonine-protein phosphatase, partial [Candidatus Binatia bacterium]
MSGCLSWKYVFASVTGTSHLAGQLPCQDASQCEVVSDADGAPVLVAAASDGAGSAVRADRGSQIVCASFVRKSKDLFAEGGTLHDQTEGFARAWLAYVRKEIYTEADAARLDPGDYASTFLGAVVGENEATFLHLGDGAIVVARRQDAHRQSAQRHSKSYSCLSWPQQGEYVNSTHFVTDDDAAEKIALCYEAGIDEIAIFS